MITVKRLFYNSHVPYFITCQAKKYPSREKECETKKCSSLVGLELTRCTRQCLSQTCYDELYAWDEVRKWSCNLIPGFALLLDPLNSSGVLNFIFQGPGTLLENSILGSTPRKLLEFIN